jgi:hypothetical protein
MDMTSLKKRLSTAHTLRMLLIYAAGILALLLLANLWREADMAIYGALMPEQKSPLRQEILLLDIDRPDGQEDAQFRSQLAELFTLLPQLLPQPPKAILLDVHFLPGNSSGISLLTESITQLKDKHKQTKIYATLPRLDEKGLATLAEIQKGQGEVAKLYASLDGFGHTEFRKTLSGKVIYYVPYIAGIRDFVSIAYYDSEPSLSPHTGERVVRIGPTPELDTHSRNLLRFTAAAEGRPAQFCIMNIVGRCEQSDSLARKDWVIIGSLKYDRQTWGISGPETVAWALNDLVSPSETGRPQPVANAWLLVALALLTSLASWGVFLLLFRLWKTPPSKLWLLAMLSFVAGVVLLAAVSLLFWLAGKIFPQVSAVLLSIVLGTIIGRLHVKAVLDDAMLPTGDAAAVGDYYDIFISYSHEPANVEWVNTHIYQPLLALRKADGTALRIFMDKSELTVGMLWFRKLALSIQETAVFLPVYSPDYFQRGYCLWESEVAQRKLIKLIKPNETTTSAFAIFPLRIAGVKVPPPYDGLQLGAEAETVLANICTRLGVDRVVSS